MITQIPSINFLSDQRARIILLTKRKFIIQMGSIAAMGLFGLFIAALFSFNGYQKYQISQMKAKLNRAENEVRQYQQIEIDSFSLKNKTQATVEILGSLSRHQKIIETVFHILPEGIYVQGVVVDDSNDIRFDASTYDVDKLYDFIAILENNLTDGMAVIDKASINQVSINQEGQYAFNTLLRLQVDDQ